MLRLYSIELQCATPNHPLNADITNHYHIHIHPQSIISYPHHPPPNPTINHPTHPKRRHNPAHPRQTAPEPIPPHLRRPRPPRRPVAHGPVIQIQPPQVQRRAEELHPGRGQELRDAGPADRLFDRVRYRQQGRDERREVEGREDGQGVARREEGVAGLGDRPRHGARDAGGRGPEHAGELAVLVEAEAHVHA